MTNRVGDYIMFGMRMKNWLRERFTSNAVPYLEGLSKKAHDGNRTKEIREAIEKNGFWEGCFEWRIFTVTEMRVDPVEREGKIWYQVKVKCDSEHICQCPTIERAVEFLGVFEKLVQDLFWSLGWPSWAGPKQMKP
jgi:hypothetical protein